MRNKLYFIAPLADSEAITAECTKDQLAFHWHSIPPEHGSLLCMVSRPKTSMHMVLSSKYMMFPDINDQKATINTELIAHFPSSVGLTHEDNTYSALHKIHSSLGMAAMHPLA